MNTDVKNLIDVFESVRSRRTRENRPNSFSFDLNKGFETFDPKEGDEKLTMLLEWIRQMSPKGGRLRKAIHDADFVCWRGLLTKVSATIYNKDEGWIIKAIRRKGVIFLMEEKTEKARQRELNQTDMEKRMSYWGHKFEQYVTRDDDTELPETSSPVTTKEEYGVVFRNDLLTDPRLHPDQKSVGILYSGEVDCLDKYGNMIELKTQKGELHGGFWKNSKSLKWWLQSSLVNVDNIIVGHRTHEGHVTSLSTLRAREMPQRGSWNFCACFDFASTVFTSILNYLKKDGDACIIEYRSELGLQKGILMRRVSEENCDFVPESFLEKYH
uniref:Decapping nuclease n=2 Tax=Caenorhabditis tropicalis TaxID=1561998 RepID=A0A1I7UIZ0_9PELO